MLEDIELYVYDKYIKELIVEDNGVKKVTKEELEKLKLSSQEKSFIRHIINKQNIKVTEDKITRVDRSQYVKDNNYGDIHEHDLQKIDEPVMSKIEYSIANEKIFEDYDELDKYLETRFIPTYVLLKQRKNENGEIENIPSIRLHHIMALKLSEAELEHVMNYLKEKNIRVGGVSATLDNEFENYDYITTYKSSVLPLSVSSTVTLQKIELYKQNNDQKLREEIITDNMRLVPYVAYRYAFITNINQKELESYGYEGLILALDNFDVSYGCAFSTYAVANIRKYILYGIQKIMLEKRDNLYYDYLNAKNAVEKENGVTLSEAPELVEDVVDLLISTGKIKDNEGAKEHARMRITSMTLGNLSLDDEEIVEELTNNGQLIDDCDYEEEVLNTMSRQELEQAINSLTDKESEVLKLSFGLYDGKPKSLEEVGKIINLSPEEVRQIESKAIRKLRNPSKSNKFRDLYFEPQKRGR